MRYNMFEIILGACILLVAGLYVAHVATYNSDYWDKHSLSTYYALFDDVNHVAPDADVRINGVKVGHVVKQSLDSDTLQSRIAFNIKTLYAIPTDSKIVINKDGLLGSNYVDIIPGHAEDVLAPYSDITNVDNVVSLEDIVGKAIFVISETASQHDNN